MSLTNMIKKYVFFKKKGLFFLNDIAFFCGSCMGCDRFQR